MREVPMIRVKLKLYATLRKYKPELGHGEAAPLELRDGATLRDLLAAIGIPAAETKQCFVNAVGQELDFILHDGDEVGVFPPIAGG
jgi:molybdopterin converting factor small subunit